MWITNILLPIGSQQIEWTDYTKSIIDSPMLKVTHNKITILV